MPCLMFQFIRVGLPLVEPQPFSGGKQDVRPPAVRLQYPRHHQAVAAVVAFAANNQGASGLRMTLHEVSGGRTAGVFHQLVEACAFIDGCLFAFAHLGAGIDFHMVLCLGKRVSDCLKTYSLCASSHST